MPDNYDKKVTGVGPTAHDWDLMEGEKWEKRYRAALCEIASLRGQVAALREVLEVYADDNKREDNPVMNQELQELGVDTRIQRMRFTLRDGSRAREALASGEGAPEATVIIAAQVLRDAPRKFRTSDGNYAIEGSQLEALDKAVDNMRKVRMHRKRETAFEA